MLKPYKQSEGRWITRVSIGNSKYKSIFGKTKKESLQRALEFENELKTKREKRSGSDLTVGEALERYVESKKGTLSPKTYREYTRTRPLTFPELHDIPIEDLTQEQVQIAVSHEAAIHEPKTVRNKHGLLSAALRMFRPDFTLHTTLPQKIKKSIVIPDEKDIIALLNETKGTEMELPIMLAAIGGMRESEICGLKWECVDFEKRTVSIKNAMVYDVDNNLVLKGTKTTASDRKMHMTDLLFQSFMRNRDPSQIFVTQLTPPQIYERYKKLLRKCCPGKDYTFHQLRHYACSSLIALGIPNKYIADYLGHETEEMVNRVYGHIIADKKDPIFDRIDTYYNDSFEGKLK